MLKIPSFHRPVSDPPEWETEGNPFHSIQENRSQITSSRDLIGETFRWWMNALVEIWLQ